jgi:malonyl CoA-acyl carrier protein transacylase
LRFAQALHISQLEELDCMPTDMDDEPSDYYSNDSAVNTNLQSASDTVPQIFTAQMDAYYDKAAQLIDQKSLAHFMSTAVGHSQGSAAAIAVAAAGDSLATLEAYAR